MTEPLRPAYLIMGDDAPQVELALKRLRRRISQESGTDLNIDEFNAQPGNASQVVAAANTLAFLGGVRLVLVHGAQSWHKADKEKLAAYLRSPAPDACLALVADKLPATDPLRKGVQAAGTVLEYWAPKKEDLIKWLQKQAHKVNLELGAPVARLLVQRVGEHQHVLLREVEKLAAYKDGEPVIAEDVELLSSRTLEASVFALTDALAAGAAARAFSVLEELYASGEDASGLFYRVLWHFEKLARTVALRLEGRSQEEAVRELGMHPFAARKLWQQAREVTPEAVRIALGALAEADAQMKGKSNLPPDLVFELCLGRILDARVPVGPREE
ncbi:MAG: DNA polymerase III subunit delta [Gaiellales bacterium]|nr:DNA polymerase III subunit delta [Gaiellales bacterium]